MEQLLTKLAELSPVIAILIYFIWYFKGALASKDAEIKELNTLLRDTQKETLLAINKMTDVVESLKELIKSKF